jgi:phytoene dehydrogenase-like protein
LGKIDFENIQHIALERWLGENIQSKDLAELIKTFCRIATYSTDSKVMSAGAALRQLHMAASSGVLYLNGGWQNLVEGLAIAAKKAKVSVVANKKVISIQEKKIRTISFPSKSSSHRMWDIILSDGKNIVASKVVLAVSPYAIKDLLNVSEPTKIQNINNEGIYPVRSACLDVLLKQLPNPNKPVAFGIDKPLYLSTHSLSANLVDKKGKGEIIHVMKYLSVYEKSNPKKDRLELEHFLNTVQPDWRKVLIKERFSPNMIVSNSIVAAEQGGLKGRLPTKAEGLEGLYIVGDWIGNEGLLADASFASAKQASMEILKEKTQRVQSIGQLINN